MTITQTVEIPADRRITVPREVPTGPVILTFTPVKGGKKPEMAEAEAVDALPYQVPVNDEGKIILNKQVVEKLLADAPHTRALAGILSGVGDITLEQIRDERLARHLK